MRTRPHWAGELLVVAFLLVIYDRVSGLAALRAAAAFAHGRDLLGLSPFGIEKSADAWLAGISWLRNPAAYYYDLAHVDLTLVVFLLCYVFRAPVYRRARTALMLVNLIGLGVFLLYPVAPPRLLPGGGFIDIVGESGTFGAGTDGGVALHANAFGSMPSLHAAWAFWVALTVMSMTTRRSLRVLGWTHVALTLVVVIITGNHYLLDLVAGGLVLGFAWAVAPLVALERWRRPYGGASGVPAMAPEHAAAVD